MVWFLNILNLIFTVSRLILILKLLFTTVVILENLLRCWIRLSVVVISRSHWQTIGLVFLLLALSLVILKSVPTATRTLPWILICWHMVTLLILFQSILFPLINIIISLNYSWLILLHLIKLLLLSLLIEWSEFLFASLSFSLSFCFYRFELLHITLEFYLQLLVFLLKHFHQLIPHPTKIFKLQHFLLTLSQQVFFLLQTWSQLFVPCNHLT